MHVPPCQNNLPPFVALQLSMHISVRAHVPPGVCVALQLSVHISVRAHVPPGVKAHMLHRASTEKTKENAGPCAQCHAATPDAGSALSDTTVQDGGGEAQHDD
jgi:hypothetical protein